MLEPKWLGLLANELVVGIGIYVLGSPRGAHLGVALSLSTRFLEDIASAGQLEHVRQLQDLRESQPATPHGGSIRDGKAFEHRNGAYLLVNTRQHVRQHSSFCQYASSSVNTRQHVRQYASTSKKTCKSQLPSSVNIPSTF